jgi:hypothetical protein
MNRHPRFSSDSSEFVVRSQDDGTLELRFLGGSVLRLRVSAEVASSYRRLVPAPARSST